MNHDERPEPRCDGRQDLFESQDRRDHEEAKVFCLGTTRIGPCPMFAACTKMRDDFLKGPHQSGIHGTWAGKLYRLRRSVSAA